MPHVVQCSLYQCFLALIFALSQKCEEFIPLPNLLFQRAHNVQLNNSLTGRFFCVGPADSGLDNSFSADLSGDFSTATIHTRLRELK